MRHFLRIISLSLCINSLVVSISLASWVIKDNEYNFIWPLPDSWERTQSYTSSQYALKPKNTLDTSCSLYMFNANGNTIKSVVSELKSDPTYLYNSLKNRYPNSSHISTKVSKMGSHDAVLTEYKYKLQNMNVVYDIYASQLITIRNNVTYVVSFECLYNKMKRSKPLFEKIMSTFSFTK